MSSEPESKPLYEKNIYMALLAQQCSRYKEMFKYFEDLIKQREKEGKPKDLLPKETYTRARKENQVYGVQSTSKS